ncbi:hypothetical protein [Paraburkholderia graminis]
MSDLPKQFGAAELPSRVAGLLEHTYSITRGTEAAIRAARMRTVKCANGDPADLSATDADFMLALAQAASELLGDRLEALAESKHRDG